MDPRATAETLRGVIAFPVTPFVDDDEQTIDWGAFREQVDRLAGSGISAIVVAGGTGELFSLRPTEVAEIARTAVDVADHRVTVLVGVGFGPTVGGELARAAGEAGADGVLILPPYYASPGLEGLVAYYRRIAAAVPSVAIAVYSRGSALVTPPVLRALADLPNVVALKDGQGDVRMFQRNRFALGDRYAWIAGTGDDLVGPYAAAGAQGYTSSVACFDPGLALELWRLASSDQHAQLRTLLDRMVQPWYELRARRPGYEVSVMKAAMEAYGYRAGSVRPPLANPSAAERAEIEALAASLGQFEAVSAVVG